VKVCVIPARGGSKRIPRKNIRPFLGRPMIVRAIETARKSRSVDRVIVSTDDTEIADIARAGGADVPFLRAPDLSDDHATTLDVLADALARLEAEGQAIEALCCLYPTAAFTTARDIDAAHVLLSESEAAYVFAGSEYPYPIQRALRRAGGRVELFWPEHTATRTQDLEPAFHDAGQFYWCRPDAIRRKLPLLGPDSAIYVMDRLRAQDIDTPADWEFAEKLFRLLHQDQIT